MPRYGPLWFAAFRWLERFEWEKHAKKEDGEPLVLHCLTRVQPVSPLWFPAKLMVSRLITTRLLMSKAVPLISRELVWKVFFEQAGMETRVVEAAIDAALECRSRLERRLEMDRERELHSDASGTSDGGPHAAKLVSREQHCWNEAWKAIHNVRRCYMSAEAYCPSNLRWKVRTESMFWFDFLCDLHVAAAVSDLAGCCTV